jgi:Fe-S-cluster-containing hydrogenase component 2
LKKALNIKVENCTGCKMCELACSMKKTGEYNPSKSRIHVNIFFDKAYAVPIVCSQCDDAWCEKICPTGAITTVVDCDNGTKIVTVNEDKCVGCKMCIMACPFGNMSYSEEGYAVKCDLCGGEPECVNYCARGALHFIDINDGEDMKRKATAEKLMESQK